VKGLFERVEHLMKDQLDRNSINFKMHIDPETLAITADQGLIEQVLINIFKNSIEAINGISIPKIELTAATDGLGNPVIKVLDNGKGIADEVAEKIFIPFFTTKQQGSGIGLSLSRQIMRQHKGTLSVSSTPGVETVFSLRF
jgi:signal transduction histidine kinase